MCDRIRSENNVFADGEACAASDVIGDAALAPDGAPDGRQRVAAGQGRSAGHASAGLLRLHARQRARHRCDRARRVPSPGAADGCSGRHARHLHHAGQAAAQARARARARVVSLRTKRLARRVVVFVRCSNAAQFTASLLVRGHVFSTASHRGSSNVVKLTLARTAHGSPEGTHPGGRRRWRLGARDHDPGAAQLTTHERSPDRDTRTHSGNEF